MLGGRRSSSPTRPTTSARSSPGARASRRAFGAAARWLLLSGTPFRSDAAPDPGRALRRRRRRPGRLLHLRRRRPRRHLPPGHVHPLRRRAAVAQRRRRGRGVVRRRARRPRGGAAATAPRSPSSSPTGCRGSSRRRTSGSRRCAPAAIATRAASSSPPTASTPARSRAMLKASHAAARRPSSCTPRRARPRSSPRSRARTERWIVAVNMVSEGVDIPRLRVGVYATAAKTPLIFRQIVGRFVRTLPGRPADMSWLYLPADPVLQRARRRGRARAAPRPAPAVARPTRTRSTSARSRRETERSEQPEAFVPVAADVAPQLALFGAGRGGPGARGHRPGAMPAAVADPEPAAEPAAFERRALLRDKRHRLVADLRRNDGRSHAEINRLAQPLVRDPPRRGRVARPARALDRAAARRAQRPPLSAVRAATPRRPVTPTRPGRARTRRRGPSASRRTGRTSGGRVTSPPQPRWRTVRGAPSDGA